jgi:hypothetical protein
MVQIAEIRRELGRFLAGDSTLRDFARWLTVVGLPLRESDDGGLVLDQIRALELCIGEYTSQGIDRPRLLVRLRALLVAMPDSETRWVEITRPSRQSSSSARTRFAEASA